MSEMFGVCNVFQRIITDKVIIFLNWVVQNQCVNMLSIWALGQIFERVVGDCAIFQVKNLKTRASLWLSNCNYGYISDSFPVHWNVQFLEILSIGRFYEVAYTWINNNVPWSSIDVACKSSFFNFFVHSDSAIIIILYEVISLLPYRMSSYNELMTWDFAKIWIPSSVILSSAKFNDFKLCIPIHWHRWDIDLSVMKLKF